MNKDQIERTKEWWRDVNTYPAKLSKWLQKLQRTEIGGHDEHYAFMHEHRDNLIEREYMILTNIAEDEKKHSGYLVDLMHDRRIDPNVPEVEASEYWAYMNSQVLDKKDYYAVNFFGEALAADRFEIILEQDYTPSDIREVISKILPDEIFHRVTLERLAGEDHLSWMKIHHDWITNKIMRKRC